MSSNTTDPVRAVARHAVSGHPLRGAAITEGIAEEFTDRPGEGEAHEQWKRFDEETEAPAPHGRARVPPQEQRREERRRCRPEGAGGRGGGGDARGRKGAAKPVTLEQELNESEAPRVEDDDRRFEAEGHAAREQARVQHV